MLGILGVLVGRMLEGVRLFRCFRFRRSRRLAMMLGRGCIGGRV